MGCRETLDSGLTWLAKGGDRGDKTFKNIFQGPRVWLTLAGRTVSSKPASRTGEGLGGQFQERASMGTWLTRGWRGRPLVASRLWRRRDHRGLGPGPVVILPPVTSASHPFSLAFPVRAIGGPTYRQLGLFGLVSWALAIALEALGPGVHMSSLPLAKYPGGCFATCIGSPWVVEADAGQHVAPPTPVLWSRSPARGGQSGQQQVHAKVRPGVLPTKPLRCSG